MFTHSFTSQNAWSPELSLLIFNIKTVPQRCSTRRVLRRLPFTAFLQRRSVAVQAVLADKIAAMGLHYHSTGSHWSAGLSTLMKWQPD